MSQTIVIDPVTRIEGHSKITIQLDDRGEVVDAHFHVTQFRGFERITQGRPVHEMPAHHGPHLRHLPGQPPRRVGQGGRRHPGRRADAHRGRPAAGHQPRPDRPVERAVVLPPLLAGPPLRLRRRPGGPQHHRRGPRRTRSSPGTASSSASGASRSSSGSAASGSTPRGSSRAAWPSRSRRRSATGSWPASRRRSPRSSGASPGTRRTCCAGRRRPPPSATSARPSWASSTATGNVDHYDGWLRVVDADGKFLADKVDPKTFNDYIGEAVEPWSYLKSTYWKAMGYPDGIYRVGTARPAQRRRADGHAARRRGAREVPLAGGPGGRLVVPLPLRAADRHAPRDREDRGAPARPGHPRQARPVRRRDQPARGDRRLRGAARHAHAPLQGGRRRHRPVGEPGHRHRPQQHGDEPGRPAGRPPPREGRDDHGADAQPGRGGHPLLRPVPLAARRTRSARWRCRSSCWRPTGGCSPS